MEEFDIKRGAQFDLSSEAVWEILFARVRNKEFDVIILSPPCGTFSRARFTYAGSFGPRPVRTQAHVRGFPWLRDADLSRVNLANFFVDNCISLANLQASMGLFFLFEHPEQLGRVKSGEVPGSIWDTEAMHSLVGGASAATRALHQCFFGATTPKPTRLASNLPAATPFGCHWHMLSAEGDYLGPLAHCPHDHEKVLVGREGGAWRTQASEAYPAPFCEFLANLVFSASQAGRQVAEGLDAIAMHPAEVLAQAMLHSAQVPHPEDVLSLFELLPRTRAHQGTGSSALGTAFFAGANWEAAGLVIRRNTLQFPASCAIVCQYIRSLDPLHNFGAFVVLDNVASACHRDHKNSASPNLVAALTTFQEGGIWHEDTSGEVIRQVNGQPVPGKILSLQSGHVYVHAKTCFHATEPWSGRRVVLIAYMPADLHRLAKQDAAHLQQLGFLLPRSPTEGEALPERVCQVPDEVSPAGLQVPLQVSAGQVAQVQCAGSTQLPDAGAQVQASGFPGGPGAQVQASGFPKVQVQQQVPVGQVAQVQGAGGEQLPAAGAQASGFSKVTAPGQVQAPGQGQTGGTSKFRKVDQQCQASGAQGQLGCGRWATEQMKRPGQRRTMRTCALKPRVSLTLTPAGPLVNQWCAGSRWSRGSLLMASVYAHPVGGFQQLEKVTTFCIQRIAAAEWFSTPAFVVFQPLAMCQNQSQSDTAQRLKLE